MIDIRIATPEDLDYCREHPINPAVTEHYKGLKLTGWAYTALIEGKILGIGGVVVYWPGVAEGWYCLSEEANNHKISLVHCIKKVTAKAFKDLNLHRLQTTIRLDFTQAKELVEHTGFELEGVMKKYTEDKQDAYLYALVI